MAKDRCDIYCYNEEKVNRIKSSSTVIVERDVILELKNAERRYID
ncbi:hypothetical protein [Priestia megaterium]|nr:hypothetical protein [Priestia megaterium]MDM8151283.1 hypothetical protein [Priestia megaterium]